MYCLTNDGYPFINENGQLVTFDTESDAVEFLANLAEKQDISNIVITPVNELQEVS